MKLYGTANQLESIISGKGCEQPLFQLWLMSQHYFKGPGREDFINYNKDLKFAQMFYAGICR